MWDGAFIEPSREEVVLLKKLWAAVFSTSGRSVLSDYDKNRVLDMVEKYPYLAEPNLVLAASAGQGETIKVSAIVVLFYFLM